MYSFGSGVLYGTRTDVANATPINFGLVQEVEIDETPTTKTLFGQFQRPLAIARGTIKTTGKAKVARISGLAMGSLFYGVTPVAGQVASMIAEAGSVATTTYVAAQTTVVEDIGVIVASTGLPLIKVASAPAVGQYSVVISSGTATYTLNTAEPGKSAILVSYTYTISGTGQKFTVSNQLLGTTPTFSAKFYTTFQGQAVSLQLNQCVSSKFTFKSALEDFVYPSFDFECFADPAGNVMTWSFTEAS